MIKINQGKFSKGFFIAILIISGAIILPSVFLIVKESVESKSWLSAKGKIVQADLHSSFHSRGGWCYKPKISYTYEVNGISYTSNDIYVGPKFCLSLEVANSILAQHWVGKDVVVFYDPKNPARAVLERK
jgi:hypothetical protein